MTTKAPNSQIIVPKTAALKDLPWFTLRMYKTQRTSDKTTAKKTKIAVIMNFSIVFI